MIGFYKVVILTYTLHTPEVLYLHTLYNILLQFDTIYIIHLSTDYTLYRLSPIYMRFTNTRTCRQINVNEK